MFNIGDTVAPTYSASWKEGIVYAITETLIYFTVTVVVSEHMPFGAKVGNKLCDYHSSLKVVPPIEAPYDPAQEPDDEDDV